MQKDVFMEQLVKRRIMPLDLLINVLIIVAAVVAVIIVMGPLQAIIPDFGSIFLMISIGLVLGAFYLIYSRNVEFEYIYTNGELDVDTIIAKRRRKRLLSVTCSQVTDAGPFHPEKSQESSCAKVVDATSGSGQGYWYLVFGHRLFGKTMLIFEPDPELLECLKTDIPKELARYVFNRS